MNLPNVVITTVGTSLIRSNLDLLLTGRHRLEAGPEHNRLLAAYRESDWSTVAAELACFASSDPICGAEVNSLDSLVRNAFIEPDSQVNLLHSDSDDGRNTASVLCEHLLLRGFPRVEAVPIIDLQDQDARRFRTHGLRNLSKEVCRIVRNHSARSCAINATGGYKAQIATAVLLGQAIGVPVYYKHERFDEIISFPPMPVALDFEVWMLASGLLMSLSRQNQFVPFDEYSADWDPRYEFLVDRTTIDGTTYIELSPTGQIFHETFRERFRQHARDLLPQAVAAADKQPPKFAEKEAHLLKYRDSIERYLQRLTTEVPQVRQCIVKYWNPDLPQQSRFRCLEDRIEGVYSNGTWTMKFRVLTSATNATQSAAVCAALNDWLNS